MAVKSCSSCGHGKDRADVQAYRCTSCNHLELFAENLLY
jgi:hypothetical protein